MRIIFLLGILVLVTGLLGEEISSLIGDLGLTIVMLTEMAIATMALGCMAAK